MNFTDLLAYSIVIILAAAITWWFIASATRSKRISRNTTAMVKILAKIAEKQGVDKIDYEHLVKWADESK